MPFPYDPWPARFVVPLPKLVDYLLDPDHPDGASKCAYLTSYGFERGVPDRLERALLVHAGPDNFQHVVPMPGALKFVFDGPIWTPNRRKAHLLTVWQMDRTTGSGARFITARPSR